MFLRILMILLCTAMSWQRALAQGQSIEDLRFDNYSPRRGLPSDFIETITQDKYGFIWLGSHNGLVRFDGMEFRTYLHQPADKNTLPDNDARTIAADSTGKLWIASRKGLFFYNYSQDNFIRIDTLASGLPVNWASSPVLDRKGRLWFFSDHGVCDLDCKTLVATARPMPDRPPYDYTVHRLFSTGAGNIWFLADNILFLFDEGSDTFVKQSILNGDGLIFKEGIQSLFEENREKLWIASLHGLYLLDRKTHRIAKYPCITNNKTDSNVAVQGFGFCRPLTGDSVLWCSTSYEGLILFNLHTKKCLRSFQEDNYDPSSLGGSSCYASFVARDGIVWISHINGLSKMDWHDQQIKSYRIREMVDSNRMMPIRKMLPVTNQPGNYWVVTWNYGLLYFNKSQNRILKHYPEHFPKSNATDLFMDDAEFDDNGTLWVGGETGLFRHDPQLDKLIAVKPPRKQADSFTIIFRISKDQHNQLWLATDNGLWKFNIQTKSFWKIHPNNPKDSGLLNRPVFALHFDQQGQIYAGSRNGLFKLDTASGNITPMLRQVGINKTDYNINYVWGLEVDRRNYLWVTTRGGGLYRYNPTEQSYTDYRVGNGLVTDELRDIFIDSLENIWISSFDGIFRLGAHSKKFTRFTPEDGLDNFNISLGRWSIIDNKIYSGSPGAFSIIDPYAKPSLTPDFPVWITGISVLDRPIHFNPDSASQITVPVKYTENILHFEFSATSYTAPTKIQFAYFLDGFDKEWHFSGNQRFANYNNLAGGSYTFRVRAIDAGGNLSAKNAYIKVYVTSAFWVTWWFRLIVLLLFGLLITLRVKQRITGIREAAAISGQQAFFRQKIAETEMVALRTQMNPHFIFNCMNIIDGLITGNRNPEAQDFLQKFSKLIRLVLENSQHQLVPLQQDMEALRLYIDLEAIRYNHSFVCDFRVDAELTEHHYRIPPLLVQPYVENAIVHGLRNKEKGRGQLLVKVRKENNSVIITIGDNGIGRARSLQFNQENRQPHQPIGMNVTGKRIELFRMINRYNVGIDISDLTSGGEPGTLVTITLPLQFNLG